MGVNVRATVQPFTAASAVEGRRLTFVARGPRGGIARGRFAPRVAIVRNGRAETTFTPNDRTPRVVRIEASMWDVPPEVTHLSVS